jgi:hypothetical protein
MAAAVASKRGGAAVDVAVIGAKVLRRTNCRNRYFLATR